MTRDEALRVLGLGPGAGSEEIRIAHRELAQMLHPDKYGDNKRLRARAEQQMKTINEARDVLMAGPGARHRADHGAGSGASRAGSASAGSRRGPTGARRAGAGASMSPGQIAFEAEARANAAETARLTVAAQARTLRERRGGMVTMAVVAGLVALATSRVGGLVFSIASMVCVWGIVDAVMISNQAGVLQKRSAELLRQRDAARRIAEEARRI